MGLRLHWCCARDVFGVLSNWLPLLVSDVMNMEYHVSRARSLHHLDDLQGLSILDASGREWPRGFCASSFRALHPVRTFWHASSHCQATLGRAVASPPE